MIRDPAFGPRLTTPGTGTVNGSIPGPPNRRPFPGITILSESPDSRFRAALSPRGYWRPVRTAGMSSRDLTFGPIPVMSEGSGPPPGVVDPAYRCLPGGGLADPAVYGGEPTP